MPAPKKVPEPQIPAEIALAGILSLLVADREERIAEDRAARKTELVLANAGVSAESIATLTGKSVAAVRKSIQRARSS